MSTTTTHHHHTLEANHHSDDPLELRITHLIREGEALSAALYNAHRKRAFLKTGVTPAPWQVREKIALVEEELELLLSQWEARHI